jgi:hypothetical protein
MDNGGDTGANPFRRRAQGGSEKEQLQLHGTPNHFEYELMLTHDANP